jgi:hypothetical protein
MGDSHQHPGYAALLFTPSTGNGHISLTLTALLLAGLCSVNVHAQPADKLPKADVILDKYVEVTGGKAAYGKLKNRITKATFEIPAQGLKADLTVYSARPNKMYTLLESDALGKIEKGTDGEVAWESNMMAGPQIKEGDEKTFLMREATFDSATQWRKLYKKVECVGLETVDDQPCYKVVLTPADGTSMTRYYNKQSGLLVKVEMSVTTPMGTIPLESYVSDYKAVDDVLLPHKVRTIATGVERLITIQSIEHNIEMPKDRFKLPEDVQVLVDKQKAEQAKPTQQEQETGKAEKP